MVKRYGTLFQVPMDVDQQDLTMQELDNFGKHNYHYLTHSSKQGIPVKLSINGFHISLCPLYFFWKQFSIKRAQYLLEVVYSEK